MIEPAAAVASDEASGFRAPVLGTTAEGRRRQPDERNWGLAGRESELIENRRVRRRDGAMSLVDHDACRPCEPVKLRLFDAPDERLERGDHDVVPLLDVLDAIVRAAPEPADPQRFGGSSGLPHLPPALNGLLAQFLPIREAQYALVERPFHE